MTKVHQQRIFGRRRSAPHTIIIAKGDHVRHFTVRPWLAATAGTLSFCAAIGLVAGGVSVALDRSIDPFVQSDNSRLAENYELRIASLRSEVDRLTTRSFADQEKVSSKVEILLNQQAQLAARYAKLQPLLERARSSGLLADTVPIPEPKPRSSAVRNEDVHPLSFTQEKPASAFDRFRLVNRSNTSPKAGIDAGSGSQKPTKPASDLVQEIGRSINEAEFRQIEGVSALTSRARAKSDAIVSVLRTEGISYAPPKTASSAEGGPFFPIPQDQLFDAGLEDLSTALDILQATHEASTVLPLGTPVASATVSSEFGVRSDPFLGRAAMHTGIDLVAERGSAVKATAAGKVLFAGDNGGYGMMVEVDHGNGVATRYAHLSSVRVAVGDQVTVGAVIGEVGSTGRSTGPHLHYEVRRSGNAIDPTRYLRAGRRLSALG